MISRKIETAHFIQVGLLIFTSWETTLGKSSSGVSHCSTIPTNLILIPYRFTQQDVQTLVEVLQLPEEINAENGVKEGRVTAFCMLLKHFVYPARLADVEMQFGWERTRFLHISRETASIIFHRWKHLLRFDPHRLTRQKLQEFALVMMNRGCPLDVISAIIDGTLRRNARPVRNQRIIYNGWKRVHALKYHCLVSPDGIVIHVYGPVEGHRHNETLYKQSGLEDLLEKHFWTPDGQPLFIYSDPAYGTGTHIMSPWKGVNLDNDKHRFNVLMSRV